MGVGSGDNGRALVHTAVIGRRRVSGVRRRVWRGRRRVSGGRRQVAGRVTMGSTPRGRVTSIVYKGGQFSLGFTLRLVAPNPSSRGVLCMTCAEFLWTGWADSRQICSKTNNEKLLSPMASGSGSGSGKRHGYVDLDAPNPSSEDPWDTRLIPAASIPSSGSSGSKKPKKARNPNRPGKEYANAAREIVLHYYKVRSLEMLHREFLDGDVDGFVNLCVDIGREITEKLEQTELYNN